MINNNFKHGGIKVTTLTDEIKKTGYQDIDELLTDIHNLRLKSEQLQKEIDKALKFKPVIPNSMHRARTKKFIKTATNRN